MTTKADDKLRKALAKSLPRGGRKDVQIQIRATAGDKAAFEDAAARAGMSLSGWMIHVARIASQLQ